MTPGPVRRLFGGPGRLVRHLAALSEPAGYVRYEADPPPCDAPPRPPRADPRTSAGQDLRAWAELLRVSALFTVPGDALAGAASAGVRPNRGTALAVGASLCLYEAGMALNDWADRDEDAVERPHRPIPSGRITPNAALAAAGGLTAAGLLLASRAGRPALALSTALAATVWAYDLRLKHTPAGPAAMGAARALDVLLGATATRSASDRAAKPAAPGRRPAPPVGALAAKAAGSVSRSTGRFSPPPARRGVLTRLSAWTTGTSGRRRPSTSVSKLAGSAAGQGRTASSVVAPLEALAAKAAGSAQPEGRGVFAGLSACADGSAVPHGAAAGVGRTSVDVLASKLAGSAVGQGRRASSVVAPLEALAATVAGATGRSAQPEGRGVFARLSPWASGSAAPRRAAARAGRTSAARQGRTATPVAAMASALAGSVGAHSPAPLARQGATPPAVPRGALVPAALLGVHTLAVTTVSRREVYGGSVGAPLAALAVTGVLGGVVGRQRGDGPGGLVGPVLGAAFVVTAGRPYLHAALNPSPQLTQRAVGGGIRAMIPFQAALAARGGAPGVGLAVMGLVPLARKLAKKVSVT
ncbi:UbiA family prenyltransferase [Streptomyces sp. NPDC057307]|uniref:UbiA family prenyltransferase n=1 Tax=Streptomyces sp. NPDC057307 TaxID=3346096 RepID=UPI003641EDB4